MRENKSKPISLGGIREATALRVELDRMMVRWSEPKTLVWVDDHPENNEVPKKVLERAGAIVHVANSTEEALALLERDNEWADLVITDMGRGDDPTAGLTLLAAMRKKKILLPSIVYSDGIEAERRKEEIKQLGGMGLVVGPVNLVQEVSRLLA